MKSQDLLVVGGSETLKYNEKSATAFFRYISMSDMLTIGGIPAPKLGWNRHPNVRVWVANLRTGKNEKW
ncbi:MAG: hypothetical protein IPL26_00360 [Leptospiraceae bacterium]|nr:hypothetical protein [Leptospiraceae bacterium]